MAVFNKAKVIKELGNLAVHSTRKVSPTDALTAARELFHICYCLARTYGRTAQIGRAPCRERVYISVVDV